MREGGREGGRTGGKTGVAYGCGPEAFACARAVEGTPATAARVAVQSATCMKTWLCLPWQLAGTTPPARIAGVRYITAPLSSAIVIRVFESYIHRVKLSHSAVL